MWPKIKNYLRRGLLLAGVLAGIALTVLVRPQNRVPEGRTPLELWVVIGAEEEEPIVPKWYNESQDEYYVQRVGLPFLEIEQKFLTAVVGNVPPDLFEYFGSVAQWSTRGALMPLDDFMERDGFDRSKIFPALWDEMMWNGKTFAIPTGTANEAFYWNKDHFREAGLDPERPPETWKELEEYALKLTTRDEEGRIDRAGYIPGYWSPMPTSLFLNWPVQKGARFLSEDGKEVRLAEPANVEALEWEAELFEKLGGEDLIEKRASFGYGTQHGFLGGQLSMIVQKSSFVQEIEKFAPDLDYGVARLPIPEDGQPGVIAGPVWIGIPSGARHPEAAWDYIKFYTQSDVQAGAAEYMAEKNLASFFPADIEAANSPAVKSQPHMDVFVKSMEWAHPSTVVPLAHTQFWRAYQEAWDAATRGRMSPKDALEKAEADVQQALNEQMEYNEFYRRELEE